MSIWKKVGFIALALMLASSLSLAANITFQVNMNVQTELETFDASAGDIVVVRGDFNSWGGVAQQVTDEDNDGIFVGTFEVNDSTGFKYVVVYNDGSDDMWESIDNRLLEDVSQDLTLDVVYFNNVENAGTPVDVEVYFRVNMQVEILNGNFDPENDMVVVRGNHANIGNWGGAVAVLDRETGSDIYSAWITFDGVPADAAIEYKFVHLLGGDPDQATWESSDNRSFTPTEGLDDLLPPPDGNGYGEIQPDVVYFADVTADDILTQDKMVVFAIDMRPAYYKLADPDSIIYDVQTQQEVTSIDEVDIAGFFNNWPWGSFTTADQAFDNGADYDATAGDSIWTGGVQFFAGSAKNLIYKYGINGLDVEAGFAQNHEYMLTDDGAEETIADVFGSNGSLYDPYMEVREVVGAEMPSAFSLNQNYPNPFNPTTNIVFAIPASSKAQLHVYNVMGQEVFSQVTDMLQAGEYSITFDATNLTSGVYFYTLKAGQFSATKKMMLVK